MNSETVLKMDRMERWGSAISFLLFSLLFIIAQLLHPNLFHIEIISTGEAWINHFRGQKLLHIAHMFEFICAPLLIIMALHFRKELKEKVPILSFIGVVMVFIGALMLLANKSALCLTISGFDTLSDGDLKALIPGLEVLLKKESYLVVLWLLFLLPLGWVAFSIACLKTRYLPLRQSIPILIGSVLLINPEIEVINFMASFFLAAGLIPYSIGKLKSIKDMEISK